MSTTSLPRGCVLVATVIDMGVKMRFSYVPAFATALLYHLPQLHAAIVGRLCAHWIDNGNELDYDSTAHMDDETKVMTGAFTDDHRQAIIRLWPDPTRSYETPRIRLFHVWQEYRGNRAVPCSSRGQTSPLIV